MNKRVLFLLPALFVLIGIFLYCLHYGSYTYKQDIVDDAEGTSNNTPLDTDNINSPV